MIAAVVGMGFLGYQLMQPTHTKKINESVDTCQSQYCPPTAYQIQVDKASHTLGRDDRASVGWPPMAGLAAAYNKTKATYSAEAQLDPRAQRVTGLIF